MKRFKKMQFADLLGIVALDREWNGYAVDEKSAEVMVRIKQKLSQLEVMGDDERRSLWLPFRTRTKHAYWRTDEPEKGLVWYYLTMTTFRDVHYLMLHDAHFHYVILKTESNHHDKTSFFPEDTYNSLLGLEQYIARMVDWIVAKLPRFPGNFHLFLTFPSLKFVLFKKKQYLCSQELQRLRQSSRSDAA